MTLLKIPIHVIQPTAATCSHACLSMVTGVPIEDIIEEFPTTWGMTHRDVASWLVRHDIMPVSKDSNGITNPLGTRGSYIVTVASLNLKGRNHSVVVHVSEEGTTILDPNACKEGKEFYPHNALTGGEPSLSSYTNVRYLWDCSK